MNKSDFDLSCNSSNECSMVYQSSSNSPAFVLLNITCISDVFPTDEEFPFFRSRYAFRVYQTNLLAPVSFVYSDPDKARRQRNELVMQLTKFWGSESLIFANGTYGSVCVVSAIRGISAITTAENGFHIFSVEVLNVEHPITVLNAHLATAIAEREQLAARLEMIRIERSKQRLQIVA